jgi:hypothetical protein
MIRPYDHPQGAYFVPCQSHSLKTLCDLLRYVNLVMWQRVSRYTAQEAHQQPGTW